ncbi:uncharacterized protein [Tiliqua scincoides]|uniref:uncharacterized protein n=1 Tax=Tiliqua scincoides TaxID=71010 RepID=UPI0034623DA8
MSCFSCKRHHRRSRYEKDDRLSEDEEPGERARKEKGLDAVAREGCPLQAQRPAEPKPKTAAAKSGDPEGHAVTTALAHAPPTDAPGSETAPLAPLPAVSLLRPPPDTKVFLQELESVRDSQAHHLQERSKALRSCQDCLRTLKAMREHLQALKDRLRKIEAELGIQVPPQELFPEELKEEAEAGGEQLPLPQAEALGEKQAAE